MIFNSVAFAIFFPIVTLAYFKMPLKLKNIWLVVISYFYYMCQEPKYALLLLGSTVVTYTAGLFIDKYRGNSLAKKLTVFLSIAINLGLLIFFKYYGFVCETIGVKSSLNIILPVGISFYCFQVIGYTIDVYRGDVEAEHSFTDYALFVSFFPQLLAGPIGRAPKLLPQFKEVHEFDYDRVRHGLFRMLWGYFMKLVISTRLAIVVDLIYGNYADCTGYQLLLGTAFYAFQIYCDFASYSIIAIGAAEVLGINLTENFKQPFFATSCRDLWRRWHISLNSWFTSYLYFPLGGSRAGRLRKYFNILVVFAASGLWHGAAWTYVIWGLMSGAFQVMGEILLPLREKIFALMPQENRAFRKLHHAYQIAATFMIFCAALVFFKSSSIDSAIIISKKIFFEFDIRSIATTSLFSLGLGTLNFIILIFSLLILLAYDILNERSGDAAKVIISKNIMLRWCVYYLLTIMILMSANIGAAQFIYFKF